MEQSMEQILQNELDLCKAKVAAYRAEMKKRLVGQDELIDGILSAFIAGGHILLEGVPGLAKTLAVKTFAEVSGLYFSRIQFTPDLLPADVTGTLIYEQAKSSFAVRKGPVFANIVLADEINRSPAKVQSAMLEAMEEGQVTIGEKSYELPRPFFVLATENPIEQEGTYNLPEAELDRFLMKMIVGYPASDDEREIVKTQGRASSVPVSQVFSLADIALLRKLASNVVCDDAVISYIVSIVTVTRPSNNITQSYNNMRANNMRTKENSHDITRYITFGASPRAGIALLIVAKAHALLAGRGYVLPEDVKAVALDVLRHRLVLSYEAAAGNITADEIIRRILDFVPVP